MTDRGKFLGNCLRSIAALFRKDRNIYKLFFAMTKKLNKFFSISTAVLVVHSGRDNSLKVIAIRKPKYAGKGLALSLPEKDSLLYRIFRNNSLYTANNPSDSDTNFIEKKLLFEDGTQSLAVCPIKYGGSLAGLVCFASPVPYAFDMIEEGMLGGILEEFGAIVGRAERSLNL
ncbi:hypothetical protein TRIP_C20475 [Candidatus Zixiibacteriota bacterium]|nr:hypothetical protein TRIP_C20475 [candidate division Zixibacteria bacterium]